MLNFDLRRQHDVPGIARHFLADFFLEIRLQGCERNVVYIELSYYQFALAPLEMDEVFCWEEREEIGLSAKEELVFILEGGVGREENVTQSVFLAEVYDFLRGIRVAAPYEQCQGTVGGNPEIPELILVDG